MNNQKMKKKSFITKLLEALVGQGSYIFLYFLFTFIAAKYFGPEIFGEYSYAYGLVSLLLIFFKAGLDNGLIYSIPQNGNKHIKLSFVVNTILSLIGIMVVSLFVESTFVILMLPLAWLLSIEKLFFSLYKSNGDIKGYYIISAFLGMGTRVLLVIGLYFVFQADKYVLLIATYISVLIIIIFFFWRNRRVFERLNWDIKFLKYSFPLMITSMSSAILSRIDVIMLGHMTSYNDVGIYQVVSEIALAIGTVLVIFNIVFAPQVSKYFHNNDNDLLKVLYIKSVRILTIISIIIFIFILFFNTHILGFFGSSYQEGEIALLYRSFGQVINIAVGGVWIMLSMTGAPKFQMYVNLLGAILNIILNFIFIPIYGINGAAFSSMCILIFSNIIGYIIVSKRFNLRVFKYF